MEWYLAVLRKYAEFSGRARRKEYWMFFLFNFLIGCGLAILELTLGLAGGLYGPLTLLYSLAVLVPGLAVTVRRLHDTGRSGWWLLIGFVPLLGAIVLLVFMLTDGQPGPNQYGPNPKGAVGSGGTGTSAGMGGVGTPSTMASADPNAANARPQY